MSRLLDFEETRHLMEEQEWFYIHNLQMTASYSILTLIFVFFKQNKQTMIINLIQIIYVIFVIGFSIGSYEISFFSTYVLTFMFMIYLGSNVFEIVNNMDVSLKDIN